MRALISMSLGIAATPGMPMRTGRSIPSPRRAASHSAIAEASKQSWVVMYVANLAFACNAVSRRSSGIVGWPCG